MWFPFPEPLFFVAYQATACSFVGLLTLPFLPFSSVPSMLLLGMLRPTKSLKSQQGDWDVKAKSLYFMQVCKLDLSACPTYWYKRRAPSSELGFYSKDGGEGFLRFRTPDWLTFVLGGGVLVSVCWQAILSTEVEMLGISFWWSVLRWCSGNLSLWSFLQGKPLRLRPLLNLSVAESHTGRW